MPNAPFETHDKILHDIRTASPAVANFAELLLLQFNEPAEPQQLAQQKKLLDHLLLIASSNWNQVLLARQSLKNEIQYLNRVGTLTFAQSTELCKRLDALHK